VLLTSATVELAVYLPFWNQRSREDGALAESAECPCRKEVRGQASLLPFIEECECEIASSLLVLGDRMGILGHAESGRNEGGLIGTGAGGRALLAR
jgi:hypothetical protein